jgi:guanylate kinase
MCVESSPDGIKGGEGIIFVISSPSGGGKTTLVRKVMDQLPGVRFSVSTTTRSPRSNEREGVDYHFVDRAVFQDMVSRGEFLEWAEVLGNFYGTALKNVDLLEKEKIDLILDVDTQGARQVSGKLNHAVLIFILPPSPRVLKQRLMQRGLDSPGTIQFRLANASKEIQEAQKYHYVIINDRMEEAVDQLRAIIIAERCRKRKKAILNERIEQWEEHHGKNYSGGLSETGGKPV